MGLLQELFRTHGPAYLDQFGAAMPSAHKKVIAAITACRTEAAGAALYECEACGQKHVSLAPAATATARAASRARAARGWSSTGRARCPANTSC